MSKLIDGNFPEYESFIPTSNESKLIINTMLTVDKFRAIKILLNDTCLAITATGEAANESINFSDHKESYCSFFGNNLTIGFNPRYIMDVLGTLKEEQVHIYLNDASSPALFKTLENPRDSFVVMPVKV